MRSQSITYADWFEAACGNISVDMNLVQEAIKRAPPGPILDLGCGSGRILNLELQREMILADSSQDFLKLAKKKAEGKTSVSVIEAKAPKIPLDDQSVSIVTLMNNTLSELSPICFSLAEIARVLKEGGTVYSVTRNPNCTSEMTFGPGVVSIGDEKIYSSYESFRMQSLGQNHYQTKITLRYPSGDETHYFVPQYYISRAELNEIAADCGLQEVFCAGGLNGEPFEEKSSSVLVWVAQKNSAKLNEARFESTRTFYDSNATRYDEIVANANFGVVPWFQENCGNIGDIPYRTLDLACGSGTMGGVLRKLGELGEIYGVDFSKEMLSVARKKETYNGLFQFDLNNGSPVFESHLFDKIVLSSGSEFIENIAMLLKNCAKSLVRRGQLFISFELTTPESAPSGVIDPGNGLVRFHYTKSQAEELVRSSGLEIHGADEIFGYFSPTLKRNIPYLCIKAARVKF